MRPATCIGAERPTRVQKMHWHWAMVVICSAGYSPRHSLQDSSGSRARSQVGRYLAVVIAEQSERRNTHSRFAPVAPTETQGKPLLLVTMGPWGGDSQRPWTETRYSGEVYPGDATSGLWVIILHSGVDPQTWKEPHTPILSFKPLRCI